MTISRRSASQIAAC